MDDENWKAAAEASNWRSEMQPDFREKIVNKMMDKLKNHLPFSGQKGLQELAKIAARFEEMYYTSATSHSDYLAKICLKMLTMETSQNPISDPPQSTIASDFQHIQQIPPMPAVTHQCQDRFQDTNMQNVSTATPRSVATTSLGIRQKQTVHPEQQPLRNRVLKRKLSQESIMQSFLPRNLPIIHQQQQLKSQHVSDIRKQKMVDIHHGSPRLENYHKPPMSHQSIGTALQQNLQHKEMPPGFQFLTKSMTDQQMLHSQGASEVPLTCLDSSSPAENAYGADWEEYDELQTIISMDTYFPGLNEIYQGTSTNLPQVKSMSKKVLNGSISDMSSIVSMVDRITGSGPGNGLRAALREGFVAKSKYNLHDINLLAQKMRLYTTSVLYDDISSA